MLRRGTDPAKLFGRPDDAPTDEPFEREPAHVPAEGAPSALGGWAAPASYLSLDAQLVGELTRAALGSTGVASLREAELAVGAMLVSLAIRGADDVIDGLLPPLPEVRLHRYATGEMAPLAVHGVGTVSGLLRSLAHCASGAPGETWEAVAHDGSGEPVAIAAARSHELRWLQPPAPDSPSAAPWMPITTTDPAPGSSTAEWARRLAAPAPPSARPAAPPPATAPLVAAPLPPRSTADLRLGPLLDAPGDPRSRREPTPAFPVANGAGDPAGLIRAVTAAMEEVLANAPLQLELDAETLDELRDSTALDRLVDAIGRLQAQVGQIDAATRQLTALTTAIDDLSDATRSLLRHQWDNMPPQGFWLRVQKADDEVRRSVDELTAEVRSRLRPSR